MNMADMTLRVKERVSQYVKNGSITSVYTLDGSKEAKDAYKKSKGNFYQEKDGLPLMWSTRPCKPGMELIPSVKDGRYILVRDLDAQQEAIEDAATKRMGRLQGDMQFFGLNKAEMRRLAFAEAE